MEMSLSPAGVAAIVKHEGVVPGPYFDSEQVPTYGVGHTRNAGGPDPLSLPRGMPADLDAELVKVFEVFRKDLKTFEARVRKHVTVPLEQHQFDALVSFDFNTGGIWYLEKATQRWRTATLVSTLNSGDYRNAGRQFMNWSKPDSIISRRQEESNLFLTGKYPEGKATVWQVTPQMKVVFKAIRSLTSERIMELLEGPAPKIQDGAITNTPLVGLDPTLIETPKDFYFRAGTWTVSVDDAGNLTVKPR